MKRKVRFLTKMLNKVKNRMLQRKFKAVDLDCQISSKAIIWGSKGISLGKRTQIRPFAVLQCTDWDRFDGASGNITIGDESTIQPFAYIYSLGSSVEIGKRCSVNPYCMIYGGKGGLKIGNYVRIAAHTVIIPGNHDYMSAAIPITFQSSSSLGIVIQDDVWIGSGVRILDGVTIAEGCVIGAGSIVTKSTEPYSVYVGNPARKIKEREYTTASLD